MRVQPEAFFLPAKVGQRFCLFYPADRGVASGGLRGRVLYIHPFAEEMNKARRMAALQTRAMAAAGFDVLQIDLLGCGDSSGDFLDATWQDWVSDTVQACHWLHRRSDSHEADLSSVPLWLWGLRAGCLLAVEAAGQLNEACNFLFWQPPSAGRPLLRQFLRLKAAKEMLGGHAKSFMDPMHQELAQDASVEISGYRLSAGLTSGLDQSVLAPPVSNNQARRLEWFELSMREDASLSPVSAKTITQWQHSGFKVDSHIVRGAAFWQTSDIEEEPALIAATTAAITA